ncbi:hypothetical protein ACFP1I_02715 [Dyadobacter subterraneus]|uniref:transposase n=1 Tax=Dyadobacter subterraneus TaxID=2773304 RepID=UPI001D168DFC
MILNEAGKMIEKEWLSLSDRFIDIRLHEFIMMPNHFHGIVEIVGATLVVAQDPEELRALDSLRIIERGQPQGIAPTDTPTDTPTDCPTDTPTDIPTNASTIILTKAPTIGDIISAFKSITTVKYIQAVKTSNWKKFNKKLWQRNYYEHIIRNEISLNNIANYIIENPKRWQEDRFR